MSHAYGQRSAVIRHALSEPRTVLEVADVLEMPAAKVRGLVNYLRKLGQVEMVGHRQMPSGQLAGVYRATAPKADLTA